MKKSKIDVSELTTRNDYTNSPKRNVIGQDDSLEPNNTTIIDKNKQFFEIGLEIDATMKAWQL